jgi:hypothetical protein
MARGRRIKGARDVGVRAGAFGPRPWGASADHAPSRRQLSSRPMMSSRPRLPMGAQRGKQPARARRTTANTCADVQRHIPPRVPVFVISASRTKAVRTVTTQA